MYLWFKGKTLLEALKGGSQRREIQRLFHGFKQNRRGPRWGAAPVGTERADVSYLSEAEATGLPLGPVSPPGADQTPAPQNHWGPELQAAGCILGLPRGISGFPSLTLPRRSQSNREPPDVLLWG